MIFVKYCNRYFVRYDLPESDLPESVSNIYQQILNQEYSNQKECIICWENVQSVRLNCGHAVLCHSCVRKVKNTDNKCPICREKITQIMEEVFIDTDFLPIS